MSRPRHAEIDYDTLGLENVECVMAGGEMVPLVKPVSHIPCSD